jgi:uncharacterized protein
MIYLVRSGVYSIVIVLLLLLVGGQAFADYKLPEQQNPPRLVNDYAHVLSAGQVQQLEQKLREFDAKTSTQISVVTINTLDGYDISDYGLALFNTWGIGQASKKNGVLLLAAIQDRKVTIRVGKGLEGVLTDAKSGQIIRNEIVPAFRDQRYYDGLSDAASAIIAVTKGEYSADGHVKQKRMPAAAIILLVIFVLFILKMFGGGGGGRGGNYMSRRGGLGGFATGAILGSMLGGGRGGGWGGGGDWGGGGGSDWGGFGGGSSGGGGASGSW